MNAWLANQIGQSAANIISAVVVLCIVIAAIYLTVLVLRHMGGGTFVVGGKTRTPRLSVRDAAAVDRTRRLVLVRRDNVEHLILIGGPTDVVIERNINIDESPENISPLEPVTEKTDVKIDSEALTAHSSTTPSPTAYTKAVSNQPQTQYEKNTTSSGPAFDIAVPPTRTSSTTGDLSDVTPRIEEIAMAEIEGRQKPVVTAQATPRNILDDSDFDRLLEDEIGKSINHR